MSDLDHPHLDAALEEDVQGVAVSSYQGGHVEYFEYLVELLREAGAGHVRVVGGGGGVIVPSEIDRLRGAGVTIFSPEDGRRYGLQGMIDVVLAGCDYDPAELPPPTSDDPRQALARQITLVELGRHRPAIAWAPAVQPRMERE